MEISMGIRTILVESDLSFQLATEREKFVLHDQFKSEASGFLLKDYSVSSSILSHFFPIHQFLSDFYLRRDDWTNKQINESDRRVAF